MTDYLAEWISERPYLIEEIQKNPSLEKLLRKCPIKRDRAKEEEDGWLRMVNQLAQ